MLASEKHDNLYNYSKFVYKGSQTPSTIICPYHGPFAQKPSVHLSGSGCPRCRAPRGENRIEQVLKHINIEYEKQFSFSDCRHVLPLHFDFALFFDRRIAIIEYNGEQHYRKISYKQSHDAYGYDDIVLRDSIKKEYCSSNEIPLLVISYEQFDIIDSLVRQFVDKLSKTQ